MEKFKNYSGLDRQELVIPAYSMHSVFFDTVNPNYYRVHNQGHSTLFCATSHQPTENQFDFSVPPETMKIYTEPFERNVLFIFNPSGNDIPVTLLTFRAQFDPIALALSDLSLDLSGVNLETSTAIDAFNTPLPAGTNKIGGVDVLNQKDYTSSLSSIITALERLKDYTNVLSYIENHASTIKGNQKDYTSVLAEIEGNQKDYSTALANILSAIGNISVSGGGNGGAVAETFYNAVQMVQGAATTSSTQVNESGNVTIHFLTNDGENQITVYFGGIPVFMKAGETIQDFRFNGSVSVGSGATFRAMVTAG